ncbi:M23 family metallopeptidase [Aeromicrobium piscarium]|uniref:Peptidoglycan DD-metalloendopeptidase family protein n=1 Tax=Aeromicrobium piscarium TaxID=2590901 RepID=A0A554RVU3_9ACTN|nr:M23 family metallopeptidase [Aeromicrobium piscarium]TSD58217.1 peptidoglycan DD-metalloendopeptidase family protein [Aeromicrobium piscarium]
MLASARKPLLAAVLVLGLLVGFTAPSAFADSKDDVRRQQGQNDQKRQQAQAALEHSTQRYQDASSALNAASARLAEAEGVLSTTRGELAVAQARDAELREQLAKAEADLEAAEARVDKAEKDLAASESEVEQFAVDSVMEGDRGLRAFSELLQGEDPNTFSNRVQANDSVGDAQIGKMQELDASRVMLELERQRVEELRDQVAAQKKEAEANVARMQELTAAAEAQAAEVAELVDTRRSAEREAASAKAEDEQLAAALESERASLERQMQAIVAEELRKQREREAAQNQGGGGGGGGNPGGGGGGGGGGGNTLSHPVSGPITSPYGMRRHPVTGVYKLHDGTDFGVGCGTPIRAAASGTVIQSYFNGAYGNRVIVNHGVMRGVSVITTYNHMNSLSPIGVGSQVQRGQVIGYVGTTGYSTGCHLHFMVLQNGQTVNPMGWL